MGKGEEQLLLDSLVLLKEKEKVYTDGNNCDSNSGLMGIRALFVWNKTESLTLT